jgi:GAF domain-containing protein
VSEDPLRSALEALSRFYVGAATVSDTLTRVAELAVQAIAPVAYAGITMDIDGRKRTAVFTDAASPEIDRAQYDAGDGPCLTAYRECRTVTIDRTRAPGPWPEFRAAAADHGIGSTLSLPLVVGETAVGALNFYASDENAFDDASARTAELFAAQAAIVLANVHAYWEKHELSEGLAEAMKNRAVIEQAKGVLIGAEGISEDAAFAVLVKASQRENVKLREIARRIVENAITRRASV